MARASSSFAATRGVQPGTSRPQDNPVSVTERVRDARYTRGTQQTTAVSDTHASHDK